MEFIYWCGPRLEWLFGIPPIQLLELSLLGLGCAAVFWGPFYSLQRYAQLPYRVAFCIAELFYIIIKFMSTAWILKEQHSSEIWQQGLKFLIAEGVISVVNLVLISFLVERRKLHPLVAQLIVSVILSSVLSVKAATWSFT